MSVFYWPISGPAFLLFYAAALALLLAAVYVSRRSADEAPAVRSEKLDCYDLALLNGGEELAVTAALANLGAAGALDLGQGEIRKLAESTGLDMSRLRKSDVERLGVTSYARPTVTIDPAVMHPVERCVYETVALSGSGSPEALRSAAPAITTVIPVLRSRSTYSGSALASVISAQPGSSRAQAWNGRRSSFAPCAST
jgi:uncharacterized protein (TIGR04222 family)